MKCPDGWKSFQNSCYKFPAEKKWFYEAIEDCKENSCNGKGRLVEIESNEENTFITTYLTDYAFIGNLTKIIVVSYVPNKLMKCVFFLI